jgi:hypothetical protein
VPIKIEWPSAIATHVEIWRLLDLSGMTKSVRESRNFTKAGFVYVNGSATRSLKTRVRMGDPVTLELRFPNGVIKTRELQPVPRPTGRRKPREQGPTVLNRRG